MPTAPNESIIMSRRVTQGRSRYDLDSHQLGRKGGTRWYTKGYSTITRLKSHFLTQVYIYTCCFYFQPQTNAFHHPTLEALMDEHYDFSDASEWMS